MALENQTFALNWKMKKYGLISKTLTIFLLFLPTSFGYSKEGEINSDPVLPFYDTPEFTPRWISSDSEKLKSFHHIPSFKFTNQDGKEVTEHDFENKIYVANFFFSTCPGICPRMKSKLSMIQDRFLKDESVSIISHSVQPSNDSVDVLKKYADKNGIKSNKWHLLTGNKDEIYHLARNAYFAYEDLGEVQDKNDLIHTESVLLIDKNRHIRGIYNGLSGSAMNNLISDIELLKGVTHQAHTVTGVKHN